MTRCLARSSTNDCFAAHCIASLSTASHRVAPHRAIISTSSSVEQASCHLRDGIQLIADRRMEVVDGVLSRGAPDRAHVAAQSTALAVLADRSPNSARHSAPAKCTIALLRWSSVAVEIGYKRLSLISRALCYNAQQSEVRPFSFPLSSLISVLYRIPSEGK